MHDLVALGMEDLARSGILDQAKLCDLGLTDDGSKVHPGISKDKAGIIFNYYDVNKQPVVVDGVRYARLKVLNNPEPVKGYVKTKQPPKYLQGPKTGTHAYFPLNMDWSQIPGDAGRAIVITEGEKKAIALCAKGIPCIALGGVESFVSNGKLLPELDAWEWRNRRVYICFDSDRAHKPKIKIAEQKLCALLAIQRFADVYIVSIPEPEKTIGPDGKLEQEKAGIDDYLMSHTIEDFEKLLDTAHSVSASDRRILELNETCAWIESVGKVRYLDTDEMVEKGHFQEGGRFSHLKYQVQSNKTVKDIKTTKEWLSHPLHTVYGDLAFKPVDEPIVFSQTGTVCLNTFRGFKREKHDMSEFIKLNKFVCSTLPPELQDFPLKLMAYKAQNPWFKMPICLVFTGDQSTGKSLWCTLMMHAFRPYSVPVETKALDSDFNNYVENKLLVYFDEAKPREVHENLERLKSMITQRAARLNKKYKDEHEIESYAMFLMTGNPHELGAFTAGDRRFLVIEAPQKMSKEDHEAFFEKPGEMADHPEIWGPRIMDFLLSYDLKGWVPPPRAPLTGAKLNASNERLSPVARLASMILRSDDPVELITSWLVGAVMAARGMMGDNNSRTQRTGKAAFDGLGQMQVRPFYSPEELNWLFSGMMEHELGIPRPAATNPSKVALELRNECGLRYIKSVDGTNEFLINGRRTSFLPITNLDWWAEQCFTQEEFEVEYAKYGAKFRDLREDLFK